MWSYVDLPGNIMDITSTTDVSTGVSTIQVYTTQLGYYSCEVTENGGSSRTYTAVMTDTDPDTGIYDNIAFSHISNQWPYKSTAYSCLYLYF